MCRSRTLTQWVILVSATLFSLALPGMVEAVCQIQLSSLKFGMYDSLGTSPLDSVGTLTYFCSQPVPIVSITIDRGGAGNVRDRRMVKSAGGGSDGLFYNIYLDPARTTVWGDGTQGSHIWSTRTPAVRTRIDVPIYGRIPGGQDISPGSYVDTLMVTINY